jgi:hypothetical protein
MMARAGMLARDVRECKCACHTRQMPQHAVAGSKCWLPGKMAEGSRVRSAHRRLLLLLLLLLLC